MSRRDPFPVGYTVQEGIYYPIANGGTVFNYSDGDEFEKHLYTLISQSRDKSLMSPELTSAIWNWPSRCHLSPARANILRPIEPKLSNRTILELGAGCGAITRYLGEVGAHVLALEASSVRARISRQRTIDQPNVKVVCSRIQDFAPDKSFDLVTLIGVLQYARLFSDLGATAAEQMISGAASMVADSGVLLIAIQNPFGLRYWGGWPEPNADLPYFGIENRYSSATVVRFGLEQLRCLVAGAGLTHTAVLFPVPDYHLASTIFTEAGMNGAGGFNTADVVALGEAESLKHPSFRRPNFSMERAWAQVFSEGLGQRLANSFVLLAARSENALRSIAPSDDELAWHFSLDRPSYFSTSTRFVRSGEKIMVEKERTTDTKAPKSIPFEHVPSSEEYTAGSLWWNELVKIVNVPDWTIDEVSTWAREWLRALEAAGARADTRAFDETQVFGAWFDATPINLIRTPHGEYRFFDLEWKYHASIPLVFVALKGIFGSFSMITSCAPPSASVPGTLCGLSAAVAEKLGFVIDDDIVDNYLTWHYNVQSLLNGGDMQVEFASWRSSMLNWKVPSRGDRKSVQDLELRVATLEQSLIEADIALLKAKTLKGSSKNLFGAISRKVRNIIS